MSRISEIWTASWEDAYEWRRAVRGQVGILDNIDRRHGLTDSERTRRDRLQELLTRLSAMERHLRPAAGKLDPTP